MCEEGETFYYDFIVRSTTAIEVVEFPYVALVYSVFQGLAKLTFVRSCRLTYLYNRLECMNYFSLHLLLAANGIIVCKHIDCSVQIHSDAQ